MATKKRVLLTAGRFPVSLDLARKLSNAGHTVLIADTLKLHGCHFSKSVDASYTVPAPSKAPADFLTALATIIKEQEIDLLIPCFEETLYLARGRDLLEPLCELFFSPFDLIHTLHHKWLFHNLLVSMGHNVPLTHHVESQEQLERLDFKSPFALKACYSRASLIMYKIEPGAPLPTVDVTPTHTWVAQEWVEGKKFCSYSACRDGEILAHATYPVKFGFKDRWCVYFEAINHKKIFNWVRDFVAAQKYTGQVGFDFIEANDGRLFAIECNPRPTSGVHLFSKEDGLDRVFFERSGDLIVPREGCRRQIALGFLAFGWRSSEAKQAPLNYVKTLLSSKDVVCTTSDLIPCLVQPFIFALYWLAARKQNLSIPGLITSDWEWNHF